MSFLLLSFIIMGVGFGFLLSLLLNKEEVPLYQFLTMGLVGGLLGRFVHVGFLDMPLGFVGDVIFCLIGSFGLIFLFCKTIKEHVEAEV